MINQIFKITVLRIRPRLTDVGSKVKCQSEDSFTDFVHNINLQNDPLSLSLSLSLHRRIQEMVLGNDKIQGIFS